MLHCDCYINGKYFTHIVSDGIIVATPSGSSAYNLGAGGSLVSSQVPAILFTPICPFSLSFRPILFPENVQIELLIPKSARTEGFVSIDANKNFLLIKGEKLLVHSAPEKVKCILI